MLKAALDVVVLFGIDPEFDISCTNDAVVDLEKHKFVVALTPFQTESLESAADLLLPIGTFAETSGTFVNCEARWQSFNGIAKPVGEARPGWKVLRVLGNLLDAENFDYQTSTQIRDELVEVLGEISPDNAYKSDKAIDDFGIADATDQRIDVPIYQVDSVVRRATALQLTPEAKRTAGAQS
jgi:NADH-quinone oxidoreductase subunit G